MRNEDETHRDRLILSANVCLVPEAELNPGILNVGFGDVGYRGVKELKAACIGRGGDTQLTYAVEITSQLYYFNFFQIFRKVDELVAELS